MVWSCLFFGLQDEMTQDLKSHNFEIGLVVKLEIQLDLIEGSHDELWKAYEDMKST
jgi:hypothetical protein